MRAARSATRSASTRPLAHDATVGAAVAGVDDDDLAGEPGAALGAGVRASRMRWARRRRRCAPAGRTTEGHRSAEPVGRDAEVALQALCRPRSVSGPKMPSMRPGSKPRSCSRRLQGGDVVAVLHVVRAVAQHAVAEAPASAVEAAPGGRPDDAVGDQTALLLEGADRLLDLGVEGRVRVRCSLPLGRLAGRAARAGPGDRGSGPRPDRGRRAGTTGCVTRTSGAVGPWRDVVAVTSG